MLDYFQKSLAIFDKIVYDNSDWPLIYFDYSYYSELT